MGHSHQQSEHSFENPFQLDQLRAAEHRVLGLTAQGYSLKQVAFELGVSGATAYRLRRRALSRLGYNSVFDLVRHSAESSAEFRSRAESQALPPLTPSEQVVALQAARGDSNASIARERGRSQRTVANQLGAIFRKLGVQSRLELSLRLAQLSGLAASRELCAEPQNECVA